jgi:hypothetical protein
MARARFALRQEQRKFLCDRAAQFGAQRVGLPELYVHCPSSRP